MKTIKIEKGIQMIKITIQEDGKVIIHDNVEDISGAYKEVFITDLWGGWTVFEIPVQDINKDDKRIKIRINIQEITGEDKEIEIPVYVQDGGKLIEIPVYSQDLERMVPVYVQFAKDDENKNSQPWKQ